MILIKNRYYTDYGLDYIFERLSYELEKRGIALTEYNAQICGYNRDCGYYVNDALLIGEKAVIFWDKDIKMARALDELGVRLLPNSRQTLEVCDDKELTYSRLAGHGVRVVKTINAPLVFDVNNPSDNFFLQYVADELGFPIVIKENVGSQGRQVYLANNMAELVKINTGLIHKPHIYQEFCGEYGCDIRVYVLDGVAIACAERKNTTDFKSNVSMGASMQKHELSDELKKNAEKIAKLLDMDYGSVDFLMGTEPVFVEANSNAYFKGIESLGVSVADKLADFILRKAEALEK